MRRIFTSLVLLLLAAPARAQDAEFFEQRIRPLLAEHCYSCHGPGKQRSGLRLDSVSAMLRGGERGPAVAPGNPEASLLIAAVRHTTDELRMPPKGKLPEQKIADLVAWVKRGVPGPREATVVPLSKEFDVAERLRHWAYRPVQSPVMPSVKAASWCVSPIDTFVLRRLEAAGLAPAPTVDPRTLVRRVYFDLIGLPPSPADVDAFVEAAGRDRQGALEALVDRLLASPRYGERWARHWLDLVRYAETMAYEFDFDLYNAWRYRDYVIRAFNVDLPYDQFVLEHLAGDLLAEPRRNSHDGCNESILATGFFLFGEGRQTPVDIRQEQADRIDNQLDVFGKAFLAQTIACARCHDHKFDAISTRDYYSLAGYLKSSRPQQAFIDAPQTFAPAIERLQELRRRIRAAAITTWQSQALDAERQRRWAELVEAPHYEVIEKGPTAKVVEAFRGARYDGWYATGAAFGAGPATAGELVIGSSLRLTSGGADSRLISERLQGELRSRSFTIERGYLHFRLAGRHARVNLIVDGYTLLMKPMYGGLSIEADSEQPVWRTMDVRPWQGQRAYIEISDSSILPLTNPPTPSDATVLHGPADGYIAVQEIVASDESTVKVHERAAAVTSLGAVVEHFASGQLRDDEVVLFNTALQQGVLDTSPAPALLEEYRRTEETLPRPQRAPALADGSGEDEFVFLRGNHRTPGERAPRRPPEFLTATATPAPADRSGRLELARRLIDPANPLLACVLVNRIWQHHFGAGLVATPDDFGRMGQPPSHPELLDYLATELVRQGWSIKKLQRLMVLSATYQQSCAAPPHPADPDNRLLHRMPMRRLEAEALRDALLAVSGRLDSTMYGPSVLPYLTPYMEGRGRPKSGPLDGNGRRSIYLNARRNFLTPLLLAFDYPVTFSTLGRRGVTSVPAQALALMNDPFVVDQAQRWGQQTAGLADTGSRIEALYQTAFARPPTPQERLEAQAFLADQARRHGAAAPAWGDLCHVLVNVKEFYVVP